MDAKEIVEKKAPDLVHVDLVDLQRQYAELTHADHTAALIRAGWVLLVAVAIVA